MVKKFDSLRAGMESPLEVTLFEGIEFDCIASSVPTAYASDKISDKPGVMVIGYLVTRDEMSLGLSFTKGRSNLGGVAVYKDAIYSINVKETK